MNPEFSHSAKPSPFLLKGATAVTAVNTAPHRAITLKKMCTTSQSKPLSFQVMLTYEVSNCNQIPTAAPNDLSTELCRVATVQQTKVTIFYGYFLNIIDLCPFPRLREGGPSTLVKISRIVAQFAVMQYVMTRSLSVDVKFPLKCKSLHELRLPTHSVHSTTTPIFWPPLNN